MVFCCLAQVRGHTNENTCILSPYSLPQKLKQESRGSFVFYKDSGYPEPVSFLQLYTLKSDTCVGRPLRGHSPGNNFLLLSTLYSMSLVSLFPVTHSLLSGLERNMSLEENLISAQEVVLSLLPSKDFTATVYLNSNNRNPPTEEQDAQS